MAASTQAGVLRDINVDKFITRTYDYIIIGGGTAGLVLANRLTENADIHVAVLEAGEDRLGDMRINIPGMAPSMLNNATYDWCFKTIPQEYLNGRVDMQPRGKLVGGSSAINYMMTTYSSTDGLDTWEKLGNQSWSAKGIQPYLRKLQTYHQPTEQTKKIFGFTDIPLLGENNGPIQTSIYKNLGSLEADFVKTFHTLASDPVNSNPLEGTTKGAYPIPASVNLKTAKRSYAANAYYLPASSRPNLHLLASAHALKILFNHKRASGVRFLYNGKTTYEISITREIILSAGTIQSPQLLELSGIGSAAILNKYGIEPVFINEAVGANLQDHIMTALPFPALNPDVALFSDPALVQKAIAEHASYASGPLSKFIGTSAFVSLADILSSTSTSTNPTTVDDFLTTHLPDPSLLTNQQKELKALSHAPLDHQLNS